MSSIFFIFNIILISHINASTLCDSPKLCLDSTIEDDYAICSGFRSCDSASISTSTSIYCYGAYGCMNSEALIAEGSVYCYGMYGCYNSTEISTGGNVYCDGYYGCRDIQDGIHSDSFVYCDGDYSCKEDKITSNQRTQCNGNYACYNATIDSGDDIVCDGESSCIYGELTADMNTYCHGKGSCRSSTIESNKVYSYGYYSNTNSNITAEKIYGYGFWSLSNSIIDSKDMPTMNVYSHGYYTGYGATVICRDKSKCSLDCVGTGCYRTDLLCYPGSDCSVEPKECVSDDVTVAIDGSLCPSVIMVDHEDDEVKLNEYLKQRIIDTSNDPKYRQIEGEFDQDDNEFEARMKLKQMDNDISFKFDAIDDKPIFNDDPNKINHPPTDIKQQQQNKPNKQLNVLFDVNKLDDMNGINTFNHSKYYVITTHILSLLIGSTITWIITFYYFTNQKCKEQINKLKLKNNRNYYGIDSEYQPLT